MISNIRFKSGSIPGAENLQIETTPVTVFVGPNNSGKSRVLMEIEQFCVSGTKHASMKLLEELTFKPIAASDLEDALSKVRQKPNPGEVYQTDSLIVGSRRGRTHVKVNRLHELLKNPQSDPHFYCVNYLQHTLLRLDGPSRIGLVNQQQAGDLQAASPQGTFNVLFRDDAKRLEVRRIIREAVGLHFVVDPTNLGQFRIRLSQREPSSPQEERGIDDAAIKFHNDALLIDQASDGIKAFTGLMIEIVAGDPAILLIDEPEAFLHPSLASKLGSEVASAATKTNKRVFVSTHSSSFLMGCIQANAPTNIVRLTFRDGVATARTLPNSDILALMRNPLLRSTNVLQGLFYEFVIVTEADADRAFYQEINERLLRFKPEWGISNCLFINAQNKQTIHTILRPLRKLGIPAAAIVDVDVLKNGGGDWTNLTNGAGVPDLELNSISAWKTALQKAMSETGKDMKRDGGINILSGSEKEAAENLLGHLAKYGVFVISTGELESWLKPLGVEGHGPKWLIALFEKMGEDPALPGYVKPNNGDVWKFLSEIRSWLMNPGRRGIPAS